MPLNYVRLKYSDLFSFGPTEMGFAMGGLGTQHLWLVLVLQENCDGTLSCLLRCDRFYYGLIDTCFGHRFFWADQSVQLQVGWAWRRTSLSTRLPLKLASEKERPHSRHAHAGVWYWTCRHLKGVLCEAKDTQFPPLHWWPIHLMPSNRACPLSSGFVAPRDSFDAVQATGALGVALWTHWIRDGGWQRHVWFSFMAEEMFVTYHIFAFQTRITKSYL